MGTPNGVLHSAKKFEGNQNAKSSTQQRYALKHKKQQQNTKLY